MLLHLSTPLQFLQPVCADLIRLGINSDGGYVIPAVAIEKSTALLSLGLGDDWSFEQHWAEIKEHDIIYVYDGEIDYSLWTAKHHESYQRFFSSRAIHVAHNVSRMQGHWQFSQAIDPLSGHQIFAKIDIEGCEYQIIQEINRHVDSIVGMAIEFHGTGNRKMFCDAVYSLQENFDIVHIHGNNTSPVLDDNLPEVVEISFLRKDLTKSNSKRTVIYMPGVDFPTSANNEEYMLYF